LSFAIASATAGRELAAIVGDAHVMGDPARLAQFAIDDVVPGLAVTPGSAEEVAAVVRLAADNNLVVVTAGGFTKQSAGGIPERIDVLLRTHRLAAVEHYDPGDLTLSASAGVTLAGLGATLRPHNQMLPVDASQPEQATIGGILATAAHGPMKHGYGGVRDYCIGIRFVTGDGKLVKAGGRVVKNVAGYDLMKLLIGSYGTLGVIVSANFKVVPRPRQTSTLVCEFASADAALSFRDRVLASPLAPICLEIVSPNAQEFLGERTPARSPDTLLPASPLSVAAPWRIMVGAAGNDAVLARYVRELGSAVTQQLGPNAEGQMWRHLSNFSVNVLARHHNAMIVHIGVLIQDVAVALRAAEKAALDCNFVSALVGRVGIGSLVAAFIPLAVDPPSAMNYVAAASALRGELPRDSSAMVVRCPLEAKRHFSVWGSTTNDVAIMRALKRALDPSNILNRGRGVV
jgi:glycolate oxidase FAD binding subunit